MQRYAIIQNNIVVNVIEYEQEPSNPPEGFDETHIAIQSDNANPNDTYLNGIFTAQQPYPSWILVNNIWNPPIPMPTNNGLYTWNELIKNWVNV
jgi:hypothetical protein